MTTRPTTLEEALAGRRTRRRRRHQVARRRLEGGQEGQGRGRRPARSATSSRRWMPRPALAAGGAGAVEDLRDGWRFDVGEWFASGEYAKELLASAAEAGVQAFESDDRILCYPAIVQVSASDATIVVDKKKDRRVRPSVVVRHLDALQQRPPKFKPEAFIETLAAAYDYVVGGQGAEARRPRQAGRRPQGADPAPGRRSRLHPPGVRPGPVPARPERRGRHQGRPAHELPASALTRGRRSADDGDPHGPDEALCRPGLHRGRVT